MKDSPPVTSVFYFGMLALLITSGKSTVEIFSFKLGVNNNFKITVLYFQVYKSTFKVFKITSKKSTSTYATNFNEN